MRFPQTSARSIYPTALIPVALFMLLLAASPAQMYAASDSWNFTPIGLSFGNVTVGQAQTLTLEVVNSGTKSLTISSVTPSNSTYAVGKLKLPQTIAAGGHMSVSVTFAPAATGLLNAHVTVASGNTQQEFGVSGTGINSTKSQLTISPSALSFGDVAVGGSGTEQTTLSASGGSVTVTSASSSSSLFALAGVKLPLTISSGKSVSVNVTFTPKSDGAASGKLSFVSNASDSTATDTMSGTGTTPNVSVSWDASTSEGVVGYNVYRKLNPSGSFAKLNSGLVKQTSYTDNNVAKGSYSYAATSVTSKGQESGYSSQVEVSVP